MALSDVNVGFGGRGGGAGRKWASWRSAWPVCQRRLGASASSPGRSWAPAGLPGPGAARAGADEPWREEQGSWSRAGWKAAASRHGRRASAQRGRVPEGLHAALGSPVLENRDGASVGRSGTAVTWRPPPSRGRGGRTGCHDPVLSAGRCDSLDRVRDPGFLRHWGVG